MLCSPPPLGERISRVLLEECGADEHLVTQLRLAEDAFFCREDPSSLETQHWNWDAAVVSNSFESLGFKLTIETIVQEEERLISLKDVDAWFDRENSRWGVFMGKTLDAAVFSRIEDAIRQGIQAGPLLWKWKSLLLTGTI
jgi:putative ATPase